MLVCYAIMLAVLAQWNFRNLWYDLRVMRARKSWCWIEDWLRFLYYWNSDAYLSLQEYRVFFLLLMRQWRTSSNLWYLLLICHISCFCTECSSPGFIMVSKWCSCKSSPENYEKHRLKTKDELIHAWHSISDGMVCSFLAVAIASQ